MVLYPPLLPSTRAEESIDSVPGRDAWSANHSLNRTEAKRRYIATLIETMHKYATTTTEARELVAELEFVWDQIKSNPVSSSSSSPGQIAKSQGQQMLPSYASVFGPSGSGRADEGGGGELRMLRPVSDGDEEDDAEEMEDIREGLFDDEEGVVAAVGRSQALGGRNRRWRKEIERALLKMATEVAALREQIEAKRIEDGRRRNGPWAWVTWIAWVTVRHLLVDMALLGLLVAWARRKGDRGGEQGLGLLLQFLRRRASKIGLPGMFRLPAERT